MKKKKKGFSGERIIDLSRLKRRHIGKSAFSLTFSKIGYFPNAVYQHAESKGDSFYILLYCVKGFGNIKIGEEDFSIKMGEFIIIPKNNAYSYTASIKNPWSIYWFFFDGEGLSPILEFYYQRNKGFKGYLEFNTERIALFDTIYKNLKRGYSEDNLMLLNLCLINFISSLTFALPIAGAEQQDKAQDIVNKAIIFMKKNESSNIVLAELALQSNLSVSHFSHVFKKKTGLSPIDYFNQIKIKRACTYLSHTDLLVKEIAYKIGIHDAAYFSRIFSKVMGMSPHAYRNAVK